MSTRVGDRTGDTVFFAVFPTVLINVFPTVFIAVVFHVRSWHERNLKWRSVLQLAWRSGCFSAH
jgi:hypothetical protein